MTASRTKRPSSSSRVEVSWSHRVLQLRDEDLFGEGLGDRCICFLCHVFTLSEVAWVEIDRNLCTAGSHYDARRFALARVPFFTPGSGPPWLAPSACRCSVQGFVA